MIKFIKDSKDDVGGHKLVTSSIIYPDIEMTLPNEVDTHDLCDAFKCFLQASGYPLDFRDEIIIKEYEEESTESTETVEVDMSVEQFIKISEMAHEEDITFNDKCLEILRESVRKESW